MRNRPMIQRDERGATLIVVAAFSIVAVIMMAFVVDIGGLRAEKKEVTLSTDAAALAAVSVIDFLDPDATGNGVACSLINSTDPNVGGTGNSPTVEDVAEHYLTTNGESNLESCVVNFGTPGLNQLYVTVEATDNVEYKFGQAIGANQGLVGGTSSARAGSALEGGVYPIGVCGSESPGPEDFINPTLPFPQYFNGDESVTIDFGNTNCGGAGNHDQLNFVGGNGACTTNIEGKFVCDIQNGGFDGPIPPTVGSNPGGGGWNGQGLEPPLDLLRARAVHIWVPVVGECTDLTPSNCSGANAVYPIDYLMEVVITRFVANGPGRGFDFDVYQVVDYQYYLDEGGLPLTSVELQVDEHICATSDDLLGCTNNPALTVFPSPPPPPMPCVVNSVTTNPSPFVDVNAAGELLAPLVVSVNVDEIDDCDETTSFLDAVAGATVVSAPTPPSVSGSTLEFTYPAGTPFSSVNNTTFTMRFEEDAEVRSNSTTVTTRSPTCAIPTVNPQVQSVPVDGNGSNRQTNGARSWTISVSNPGLCGAITGRIVYGSDSRPLTGTSTAAATMTFTLPDNTPIPNGAHNKQWSVRFFNGGNLLNSSAVIDMT